MPTPSCEKEIAAQLHDLSPDQQQRVLAFVRALVREKPAGVPGSKLLRFARAIEPDDLRLIEQAVSEGCEQVNLNEW